MTERATSGTRERILAEALELFIDRGYARTSISLLAERLGLSKAAVLYHFPSKDQMLVALAHPLLRELEIMLDSVEELSPERARWVLLERWLETMIAHRRSMRMFMQDMSFLSPGEVYQRFLSVAARAQALVAGPDPDLAERVRAVQAVGMLGDPMIYLADIPARQLAPAVMDGVRRLLAPAAVGAEAVGAEAVGAEAVGAETVGTETVSSETLGAEAASSVAPAVRRGPDVIVTPRPVRPPRSYARGRPPVMTPWRQATAERLLASGDHTPAQIASVLGVSRATIYRYLATRGGDVYETGSEGL